jgi:hypothetical protein
MFKHLQSFTFIFEWVDFFASFEPLTFAHELNNSIWMLLNPLFMNYILHSLIFFEMDIQNLGNFIFIFEWVNEFVCISWTINICTWVESFILNIVKSITHELHFALTNCSWNGCIKIWKNSHLYLNGLVIKSKCSCMQILGSM